MKNTDPAIQTQVNFIRAVENVCAIKRPTDEDKAFRAALLRRLVTMLPDFETSFTTRIQTALCNVEFNDADVTGARAEVQRQLYRLHGLGKPYAAPAK